MVGELLVNRYRVLRHLGEGAMGEAWLVDDTTQASQVALKVVSRRRRDLSASDSQSDKSDLEFIQEFRLMTQLRHPNCCEVLDYGLLAGEQPYMTMEFVPGQGLDEVGRVDSASFVPLFSQIVLALSYIHSKGLVHCDLKAANVRLRPDGVVKVMDYGLMEYAGRVGGAIKGTLSYLAPEVFRRGVIDRRTDLYALGVLGFEMLTGRLPFIGERPGDIIRAHIDEQPPRASALASGVDARHERVVQKLLAKDPVDRFQSAEEVLEALGVSGITGSGGGLLAPPLVGRAQHMARLFVLLARITAGKSGATFLLQGPAGSGKSRLAKEFSFNVRLENLPYAEAHHSEFAQGPYASLTSILRALMPYFQELVPEELAAAAPTLTRILPELAGERSPVQKVAEEKSRLHHAIVRLLCALARQRGTVLLIEDLQWMDGLTREVLEVLFQRTREIPLLLLLTSRDEQTRHFSDEHLKVLDLSPLSRDDTQRMVAAMLGTPAIEPSLVDLVAQTSLGNPGYVELFLEHLVQCRALQRRERDWVLVSDSLEERETWAVSALLARKFAALVPSAQALARVAAVWGREFTFDTLRALTQLEDDEFFEALEALRASQIFAPAEEGRWSIPADGLRQAILETLRPGDRRLLHTRIAELLLEPSSQIGLDALSLRALSAATYHLFQGDNPGLAVRAALELGARLLALSAHEEARMHLEAGLKVLRAHEPGSPVETGLLRLLGEVHQQAGHFDLARAAYAEVIPMVEALGDRFLLARVLISASAVEQALDSLEEALRLGERAHRVSLDAADFAGAARARLLAGKAAGSLGRTGDSLMWLREALDLARLTPDEALVGECLAEWGFGQAAWLPDNLESGVEALCEALSVVTRLEDPRGKMRVLTLLGQAQLTNGEFAAAQKNLEEARNLATQLSDALELCTVQTWLALCDLELGAFEAAAEAARRNVDVAGKIGSRYLLGIGLMTEVVSEVWCGNLREASALMGVAFEQAGGTRHAWREARMLALKGDALALMGRHEESLQTAERLQSLMIESGNLEPQGRLCLLWGENLLRAGAADEAAEFFDRALELVEAGGSTAVKLRALLGRARLALQTEQWDKAGAASEQALQLAQQVGVRHAEAMAWGLRAEYGLAAQCGTPAGDFTRMLELASLLSTPLLEAQALFGLAAAAPYSGDAPDLARRAKEVLDKLVSGLPFDNAEAYLAAPEVRRIREGNYVAFSLRRHGARHISPPKIDPGAWLR